MITIAAIVIALVFWPITLVVLAIMYWPVTLVLLLAAFGIYLAGSVIAAICKVFS